MAASVPGGNLLTDPVASFLVLQIQVRAFCFLTPMVAMNPCACL